MINEIKTLKEKGIYDFFSPQKLQTAEKLLTYLERNGTITKDDIDETKNVINSLESNKIPFKEPNFYATIQKETSKRVQSIKAIEMINVAKSSSIFWNNVVENDGEFVGIAREIGLVLADCLGALVGGPIGAAIFSIAFIITWWLLENE